jgi:hypothetical protein
LSDEIQQVRLDDIRGSDGNPAPYNWFNGGTRRRNDVMAITSFGILVMALRQRKVNEDFMNSEPLGHVRRVVNAIPLEQFGANFTEEDISCEKISNDNVCRQDCANMYTGILLNKSKEKDAKINSLRSTAGARQSIKAKTPAEYQTPDARISTSEIISLCEMPPEKK